MSISEWFRGRSVSLADLLSMPIGYVLALNKISYDQNKDRLEREKRAAAHAEDAIAEETR